MSLQFKYLAKLKKAKRLAEEINQIVEKLNDKSKSYILTEYYEKIVNLVTQIKGI